MSKFGGGDPICPVCEKRVYKMEEIVIEKQSLHKTCFRCTHCDRQLTVSAMASVGQKFYCKTHYLELFQQSGGKYSVFGADDQFKHKASNSFAPGGITGGGYKQPSVPLQKSGSSDSTKLEADIQPSATFSVPSEEANEGSEEGKRLSFKDRMAQYTARAGGLDEQDTRSAPVSPPVAAPIKARSDSSGSRSSVDPKPGMANAASSASADTRDATTSIFTNETREVATSVCELTSSSSGKGSVSDEGEVARLAALNCELEAKLDSALREKEAMAATISKLKVELAEQTAKALEADEWVAKLVKDREGTVVNDLKTSLAAQGKPAPKSPSKGSPKKQQSTKLEAFIHAVEEE